MKKGSLVLICACLLVGCSERMAMTGEGYANIEMGMSTADIERMYGKPYAISSQGDGSETYEYIERIRSGERVLELRSYYIVVVDGKVVGKYLKVSTTPGYDDIYSTSPYPNN